MGGGERSRATTFGQKLSLFVFTSIQSGSTIKLLNLCVLPYLGLVKDRLSS